MTKLDTNRLILVAAVVLLVLIAAGSGYRLEIGPSGLTFERGGTDPSGRVGVFLTSCGSFGAEDDAATRERRYENNPSVNSGCQAQ